MSRKQNEDKSKLISDADIEPNTQLHVYMCTCIYICKNVKMRISKYVSM